MSEGNVYEAAAELREPLWRIALGIEGLGGIDPSQRLGQSLCRGIVAGRVFVSLLDVELAQRSELQLRNEERVGQLTRLAWQLADALEAADPRRRGRPAATPAPDAKGGGIDLSRGPEAWDDGGNQSAGD